MNGTMFNKEKQILQQVIEASEAIRQKHNFIKHGKVAADKVLNQVFKPVVTQLEKLRAENKNKENEVIDNKPILSSIRIKEEKDMPLFSQPTNGQRGSIDEENREDRSESVYSDPFPRRAKRRWKQSGDRPRGAKRSHDDHAPFPGRLRKRKLNDINESVEPENWREPPTIGIQRPQDDLAPSPERSRRRKLYAVGTSKSPEIESLEKSPTTGIKRLQDDDLASSPGRVRRRKLNNTIEPTPSEPKRRGRPRKNPEAEKAKRQRSPIPRAVKRKVVEPLTIAEHVKRRRLGGFGLPDSMVATKKRNVDYVYWDDPNELVDRLRLLYASQLAGNTSHNNEIISIIEELREADLIY